MGIRMDRLDAMRLFTRIVERRSFTVAAQDLEVPRSTATQVIKELEARLGVRLLQRTTRSVRSTLDGEAYYQRCVAILGEIEEAESAFRHAKPHGLLRVDVHGTLAEVTCASPAYVARHGMPAGLSDLDGHVAIAFMSTATGAALPLEFTVDGELQNIALPATVTVAAAESYVAAARLGLGLIQVPHYHVAADLAAGSLLEVLPAHRPSPTPVSLLYPHRRQLSLRVRVFIDWLAREFAKHPEVSMAEQ